MHSGFPHFTRRCVLFLLTVSIFSVLAGCPKKKTTVAPAVLVYPAGTTGVLSEDCPLDKQGKQLRPCKMNFDPNAKVQIKQ
jgi:hypothetical protein